MKKRLLCILLLFGNLSVSIHSKITFGSTNSSIKISDGGRLHLGSNLTSVDGTIFKDESATISAETDKIISFSHGILENNETEIVLTALYNPNLSSEGIQLSGNNSLRAEPGMILEKVYISNDNNRITGQPLFGSTVLFDGDLNTSLTVAIHNKLNQDIALNNGTLVLDNDLGLADGAKITGGGIIRLNNRSFSFGSQDMALADSIYWDHAADIYLNGKISLANTWTFSDTGVLNGNGNILDLTQGGTIFVEQGSTLYLTDIVIKGLGNGDILFGDNSAKIYTSNVDIELASSYTTTIGGIYAEGPTTFILEDNSWYFNNYASLTVDGIVLWTDRKATPTEDRGKVLFVSPEENYFTSINSGTIKEKVYLSDVETLENLIQDLEQDVITNSNAIVTNSNAIVSNYDLTVANSNAIINLTEEVQGASPLKGTFTEDHYFDTSGHLHPGDSVTIAGDLTLGGSGAMLVFSDPENPQFIIKEGKTLTLEEVHFQNINAQTFQCEQCSRIKIGNNVTFGFSEDVILTGAQWEITGNSFTIRGMGGRKRIGFLIGSCVQCSKLREYDQRKEFESLRAINIANKTLTLQNIELMSIEDIGSYSQGIIKLTGESIINFDESSSHNFVIEGIENEFRLLKNDILFSGKLTFGNQSRNSLFVSYKIPNVTTGIVKTIFADGFAYISSEKGIAELEIANDVLRIQNQGYNSFVVGKNSFLGGVNLEIYDKPIRQISDYFEKEDALTLSGNISPVIVQANDFYKIQTTSTVQEDSFTSGLVGHRINPNGTHSPLIFRSIPITHGKTYYLNEGTTIKLTQPKAELKPEDNLFVLGKNNTILVNDTLTINGKITLDQDSDLTFKLNEYNENATIRFDKHAIVDLLPQSKIVFKGKGFVERDNGDKTPIDGGHELIMSNIPEEND